MYHPKLQPISLARRLEGITISPTSFITSMITFLAKAYMLLPGASMNGKRVVLLFFPDLCLTLKSTSQPKKKRTRPGGKQAILVLEDGAVLNKGKLKRMMENTTVATVWESNFLFLKNVQDVFPSNSIEKMLSNLVIGILPAMTRRLDRNCNLNRIMIHCPPKVQHSGLLLFYTVHLQNLSPLSNLIC